MLGRPFLTKRGAAQNQDKETPKNIDDSVPLPPPPQVALHKTPLIRLPGRFAKPTQGSHEYNRFLGQSPSAQVPDRLRVALAGSDFERLGKMQRSHAKNNAFCRESHLSYF
jgi:hypothetical protein